MKSRLKKKRSFWKSISNEQWTFIYFISLFILAFATPFLALIPGGTLIGYTIAGVFVLIAIVKFIPSTIIRAEKCFRRFVRANKIIQKLPLSEEELKDNHITTAEEYLQLVYEILEPIPMSYWYENRFDYGDDPLMKEMSKTYHSFAKKENVCHCKVDFCEEDSDVDLFVCLLCGSCCPYQSVDCDKCKRNTNVFVPKKK